MTFPTTSTPFPARFHFGQALRNIFADFIAARARRAVFEKVYRDLSVMSDRDLADINISRHKIRDIALEAAQTARLG